MAASTPTIPQYIIVHLGAPTSSAKNVSVGFAQYIKNVASSEIYPTWPENAIRANIYAEITFALNRVYTEHYRSKGYDFDITSSTQYDQSYVQGRDIFENISQIVDEIFNDYVVKQGQIQPYFTQYCAGSCDGLSQWGTVPLAESGLTPYQILQKYYGDDIDIVENAPVSENTESYPGRPLKLGSAGEEVIDLQRELNRIANNYPSIPTIPDTYGIFEATTQTAVKQFQKIFNLSQDGVVGKQTWYKIIAIYNGIKGLSELYTEGISITEAQRKFSVALKKGDSGNPVKIVQYYLAFLGRFNPNLPEITVDGYFGDETRDAVLTFQNLYGLDTDGVVGRDTWNMIQDAYNSLFNSLPDAYKQYSSLIYPGYYITTGATGSAVTQVQKFINAIAEKNPSIPSVDVDGIYGDTTESAVKLFQMQNDITPTGQVGAITWNALANEYNSSK